MSDAPMSTADVSRVYLELLDSGQLAVAEAHLLSYVEGIGYPKITWHLWRFLRFEPFQGLRQQLFACFLQGKSLSWQALELLFYLQEHQRCGIPDTDATLMCNQIFAALCNTLGSQPKLRAQALSLDLIWHGLLDKANVFSLPAAKDEDALALFGPIPMLDAHLMELALWNRSSLHTTALTIDATRQYAWTQDIDPHRAVDLYVGPYFFKDISVGQRKGAHLPEAFKSPFRDGLRLLAQTLMENGWQIVPWLCSRGAIAPVCKGVGRWSFSYHTRGVVNGRLHYKFGHFSDLMQIDPLGYAGYSQYANRSYTDVLKDTAHLSVVDVAKVVARWHTRYIVQRFTWRVQHPPDDTQLPKGRDRTVFVPLQDPFDEVAALRFMEPAELIDGLLAGLGQDDIVYVKRHPVDASARTQNLLQLVAMDSRVQITEASIYDLFEICDTVVTVNSGVGFEAMLAGLRVIVAGKSDYNLGATTVENRYQLLAALTLPSNLDECELAWSQRVLYHYFVHHIFDPTDQADFQAKLMRLLEL